MNINETLKMRENCRKKICGRTNKTAHISAFTYHKLQTLELIKTELLFIYSKVSYANDLIQIFINIIKIKVNKKKRIQINGHIPARLRISWLLISLYY